MGVQAGPEPFQVGADACCQGRLQNHQKMPLKGHKVEGDRFDNRTLLLHDTNCCSRDCFYFRVDPIPGGKQPRDPQTAQT